VHLPGDAAHHALVSGATDPALMLLHPLDVCCTPWVCRSAAVLVACNGVRIRQGKERISYAILTMTIVASSLAGAAPALCQLLLGSVVSRTKCK
jgi:hypothetical protein